MRGESKSEGRLFGWERQCGTVMGNRERYWPGGGRGESIGHWKESRRQKDQPQQKPPRHSATAKCCYSSWYGYESTLTEL